MIIDSQANCDRTKSEVFLALRGHENSQQCNSEITNVPQSTLYRTEGAFCDKLVCVRESCGLKRIHDAAYTIRHPFEIQQPANSLDQPRSHDIHKP